MDAAEGWITWVRVCLLTLVGAILPLIVPRRFVPVDPKVSKSRWKSNSTKLPNWLLSPHSSRQNPLPPNPEQTASILSFIIWTFLDPVVLEASRVSHLPYESLPILADYDYVEHLMTEGAPTLDPSLKSRRDRHFVWSILWLYRECFESHYYLRP